VKARWRFGNWGKWKNRSDWLLREITKNIWVSKQTASAPRATV